MQRAAALAGLGNLHYSSHSLRRGFATAAHAQGQALAQRYAIVFAGQALGGDDHEKNRSRINGQLVTREGA